jgi:hypothetical protein
MAAAVAAWVGVPTAQAHSRSFVVDVENLGVNVGVVMNSTGEPRAMDVVLSLDQLLTHASTTLQDGAQLQGGLLG